MRVVEAILKIAPSQVNFAYFHTNLGSSSQLPAAREIPVRPSNSMAWEERERVRSAKINIHVFFMGKIYLLDGYIHT